MGDRHNIPSGPGSTVVHTRRTDSTTSTYYTVADHLGSGAVAMDGSGAALVNLSFAAYGKRRGAAWNDVPLTADWTQITAIGRDGFTGYEHLDNVSVIHMNGRAFDPLLGRFLSADPVFVGNLADPQSLNPYSYVRNSPLSATDPSGFATIPAAPIVTPSGGADWDSDMDAIVVVAYRDWRGDPRTSTGGGVMTINRGTTEQVGQFLDLPVAAYELALGGYVNDWIGLANSYRPQSPAGSTLVEEVVVAAKPQHGENASSAIDALSLQINLADLGNTAFSCASGVCGDWWSGINGKWYSTAWGGNQYTGARRFVLADTEAFRGIGKGLFVVDLVLNLTSLSQSLSNNDKFGAFNSAYDIAVNIGGVAGGNFGFAYSLGNQVSSALIAPWASPLVTDGMCSISGNC